MRRPSLEARLGALERLEAERAAAGLAEQGAGLPPLGGLTDEDVLWETLLALRSHRLHAGPPGQLMPPIRLSAGSFNDPIVARWYATLAERAQPLIDAEPQPFVPLTPWEAADAIAAIDAGRVAVTWITGNVGLRSCYRLIRAPDEPANADLDAAIVAVNYAVRLWAWQMGYPQVGAWELRTLDAWRGWLMEYLSLYDNHEEGT